MPTTAHDYDLFLSHASEDAAWTEKLARRLRGDGLRIWFDVWEIKGGDNIPDRIDDGLKRSRQMAAVWTRSYFDPDKKWTIAESHSRQHADVLGRNRLLIPLLREQCEVPALLAALARIDFRDDQGFDTAIQELRNALNLPDSLRNPATVPALQPLPRTVSEKIATAEALGPLLDPVLLVVAIAFLGVLGFGSMLVSKGSHLTGAGVVVPSFVGCLTFLYLYSIRRAKGAPSSGMEFAFYLNARALVDEHQRSASEQPQSSRHE
jgi:hypothetical protein